MSEENVETVRRICEPWSRGDFSSAEWADPGIEFSIQFASSETHQGMAAMEREWRTWLQRFEELRTEALDYFDAGDQVVALIRFSGRAKASGMPVNDFTGAARFAIRDGQVMQLHLYSDRSEALRDAGIDPKSAGV